jgi:hypothetical protein
MSPLQASSGWSSSEEAGNNTHGAVAAEDDVDTGAALVAGISGDLDPAEAARVRYVLFDCFHARLIISEIEGRSILASYR